MAKEINLAASSQTKANNQDGLTTVMVVPPRKITYVFTATSASNLSIPYAVAVDGKVLPSYASKPARVGGAKGKFTVTVRQGQQVSLYLNSDAHPDFRKHPVYIVTAGERNATVQVTEKKGKHKDADTPIKKVDADAKKEAAKTEDLYVAPLTGDIWMKVSHKYTEDEVDKRLPPGSSDAVKSAVKSIYRGLGSATLTITEPAVAGKPSRSVAVHFMDSNNPKDNISDYTLLADGLPRVHPGGFAALFTAALDNAISSITVSSCWRPMLGSIAHRAGLGLDVAVVGGTKFNRQELRKAFSGKKPSKQGNHVESDNVTDAEVEAFGEYEDAIFENKKAAQVLKGAQKDLAVAKRSNDAEKVREADARVKDATDDAKDAAKTEADKREEWNKQRDAGEPANARLFRTSLLKCSCVRQLFDPWFMDENAQDETEPHPNMQKSGNETLHAHHLHITVDDARIL